MGKNAAASEIVNLQKSWQEYVIPKDTADIEEMIEQDLIFFVKSPEGKILATVYRQPLRKDLAVDDPEQILKIGGLSLLREGNNKGALLRLMREVRNYVVEKNVSAVMCTSNDTIARVLKDFGCIELTYEEFSDQHPEMADIFMESETAPITDEKFYLKLKK